MKAKKSLIGMERDLSASFGYVKKDMLMLNDAFASLKDEVEILKVEVAALKGAKKVLKRAKKVAKKK